MKLLSAFRKEAEGIVNRVIACEQMSTNNALYRQYILQITVQELS